MNAAATQSRPCSVRKAKPPSFIRARIAKGTTVHTDESGAWDNLHERFEMKRINHQEAYSFDGACTNWACADCIGPETESGVAAKTFVAPVNIKLLKSQCDQKTAMSHDDVPGKMESGIE